MNIEHRITALIAALEREKQGGNLELDDLSMSLYELEEQMCSLTDADIEAMADDTGMTTAQARAFVDEWRQRREERTPRQQQRIDRAIANKKKLIEERRR